MVRAISLRRWLRGRLGPRYQPVWPMISRLALSFLTLCVLAPASASAQEAAPPAPAADQALPPSDALPANAWNHGLSLIGKPRYPADFKHFDYVNADAPKGGAVRMAVVGAFDSTNPVLYRGVPAAGIGMVNEQLMSDSLEEPQTAYGLLAESVSYPPDYSSVTFRLRENAKWHDGRPVTPEDVIWSLEILKQASPRMSFYYKNVTSAEKTGEREVTFRFDVKNNRELPMILGQVTVLPKHWWTAKDAAGDQRDPLKTTLEPPLGSGPYRVKEVVAGRTISYERVPDYWGKDLPVNLGQYNFDEIRFEYYRDDTVSLEAFKSGRVDFRVESSAKNWSTAYDFPAVKEGRVKKEEVLQATPKPMQAFVMNLRRAQFQDARVRRAMALAYDFEWANKNLMFGLYRRTSSYFENTELASRGLPQGRELEILNEVKGQVPPEVFTTEFKLAVNNTPEDLRDHLREASDLLKQAGWTVKTEAIEEGDCGYLCRAGRMVGIGSPKTEPVLRNQKGEPFRVEFLLSNPLFERITQPYMQTLARLGIQSQLRIVDTPQYEQRQNTFDYDMVVESFFQSESPGNEQREYWGSDAAKREGSQNLIGIQNAAIDKLIDHVIFARDRAELVSATHALDRVLLWNQYVVPQWFSPVSRLAYWTVFGQPKILPTQGVGFMQVWWRLPDRRQAAADPR